MVSTRPLVLAAAIAASLTVAPAAAPISTTGGVASAETGPLAIRVLSNRADLISGGDALVQIVLPAGTKQADVRVDVDGKDVTAQFAQRPDGRHLGLLKGLKNGKNVVTARVGRSAARITITNHPVGGPIFAGPQVQPWFCTTADNGLGPAVDSQCNAPTKISYKYRSSLTRQFADYNPSAPPPDVATTTTDTGLTVPYIVRVERGTADRGIYEIAVLADPARPWKAWAPQPTWNDKLLLPFGQSTAPHHRQTPPTTTLDCALLLHYWNTISPQLWAALPQRSLVSGHMSPSSCHAWVNVFAFGQAFNPSQTAGRRSRTSRSRAS